MSLASLMDAPTTVTQREFPMRMANAKRWGNAPQGDRDPRDPVKLGGCGRVFEGGSWVPVYATGDRWSPGSLATCDNPLLCDHCGPREQAESVDRWRWHFEDWQAGGGQLIHVRLSFAHGRGDDLAPMLNDLRDGFTLLRKSDAWAAAGIVDWVRVLHVRWSPDAGWYPHYHVTGFIAPGHEVDELAVVDALQMAWRDRVSRSIGRKVSRRHGLFARVVTTGWRALYAWNWADRDDDETDEPVDVERGDWDRDTVADRGSWPLYRLAESALDDDRVAWRAWEEIGRALKGVPVVRCTNMLNEVWADHQATLPELDEGDAPELELKVQVHSGLWERARRRGCTEMALEVGRLHGVDAMAQWWARRLGCVVTVTDEMVPRLSARDGPGIAALN